MNGAESARADFSDDLEEVVQVAGRGPAEAGERLRPGDRIIAGSITPQVGPLSPAGPDSHPPSRAERDALVAALVRFCLDSLPENEHALAA